MHMLRDLDQYELRRLIIYAQGLLVDTEGPRFDPLPEVDAGAAPRKRYRQQSVNCGKAGCTRCPHGPYWYAYWREDGRVRTKYVGKELPEGVTP